MEPAFTLGDIPPLWIAYYAIAVNLWVFVLFGWDKMRAENGGWRVPEATMLMWAVLGGSPAAFAGRALFRHKTRKQPFVSNLYTVVAVQLVLMAIAAVYLILSGG